MKNNQWQKSPQYLVDTFYEMMEEFSGIELKKMFGYPCAFINGNMFIGLHEGNMAVRVPPDFREEALNNHVGFIFAPMKGRVMKEYIALSSQVIADKSQLRTIILHSLEFVKSLPKKPLKRKS